MSASTRLTHIQDPDFLTDPNMKGIETITVCCTISFELETLLIITIGS